MEARSMTFNTKTFRSLEFLLLVLTNIAAWLLTFGSTVSPHNAVIFSAASAAVYALARGLAKMNADVRNYWETSEFWIGVIGALIVFIGDLQGVLSDTKVKQLIAGLTFALMIARGLAKAPATQVLPPSDR
jgi:hypothetical protein